MIEGPTSHTTAAVHGHHVRRTETERRDAVYRAAMALIAERGIGGTRVADIGRRVGMSPGHVLYYFGTKERLLLETLRWSEGELGGLRAAASRLGRAGWPKLRRFVDIYLPEGPSDPRWALWVEVWGRIRQGDLAGDLAELERRWRDDCAVIVREGAGRGAFRDVDAEDFAVRFVALLDGLSIGLLEGVRDRTDVMRIAERGARVELEPIGGEA